MDDRIGRHTVFEKLDEGGENVRRPRQKKPMRKLEIRGRGT